MMWLSLMIDAVAKLASASSLSFTTFVTTVSSDDFPLLSGSISNEPSCDTESFFSEVELAIRPKALSAEYVASVRYVP